jgi:hypothetical protein
MFGTQIDNPKSFLKPLDAYLISNPYEIQGFSKVGFTHFTLTQILLSIRNPSRIRSQYWA